MSKEKLVKKSDNFMTKMAKFIVDKRNLFCLLVIIGIIFSAFSIGWVKVENDLVEFLPESSETKLGMEIMEDHFVTLGTAQVMVANVTYEQAAELYRDISEIEGVQSVTFDQTPAHYHNASALFTVSFDYEQYDEKCERSLEAIKELLSRYDVYVSSTIGYSLPDIIAGEVKVILVYVAIIIFLVLLVTSQTYAEIPVLLLTFVVAAILNMGTNFLMGTISFVSNSVTTVLQLALSLDYAVIFCNRYKEEHEKLSIRESVITALSKSIPEICASSMTTMGGLFAMVFMQFKIGPDMGVNLIKSIFFALFSVFVVMPALLMWFGPWMDKTKHKNFIPNVSFVGKFAHATRFIIPPVFIIVLVIAWKFSGDCPYVYGYNNLETAKLNEMKIAEHMIADNFTSAEMVALVVPAGDYEAEGEILERLSEYEEVESSMGLSNVEAMGGYVLSDSLSPREFAELADLDYELAQMIYAAYAASKEDYAKVISSIATYEVPLIDMFLFVCEQVDSGLVSLGEEQMEMLSMAQTLMGSAKQQLQSEEYSRMLVYLDIPEGGDTLYAFLDTMRGIAQEYYPDGEVYVVGNPTSEYDFQKTFSRDNIVISILTIMIVLVVLLFTFKSVGMPLLLILVIQGSIWMNFSVPALTGGGVFFMTYLIVSAIQMGANIDYAIVTASRFMELKDKMPHKQAIVETMNFAFPTIFISGTIMASASLFIGMMTSEGSIANMGLNLARGTLISIVLVMFVLPQLLLIGAKLIDRTSFSVQKVVQKYGCALICLFLVLGAAGKETLSVKAQDAVTEETIKIKDAEDLLEFAQNCTLDVWSQDKTVILQADIYMEEIAFEPIATFGGTFDGKGHSIAGLEIGDSVSPAGLFGVLQEGAVVKNLNVLGKVMPSGESNVVGGIVGENHGQIRNCTFTGMVYGSCDVGGIAGVNGVSGSVQNCRVSGDVCGSLRTGGVVGHNQGLMESCKNDAGVNTAKVDPQISMEDINLDISMDVTQWAGIHLTDAASDTGGIAGYSSGVIHECSNAGVVGYSHIGYNLGGIAGRSSGYIASCDNAGEVYGRKDIGGIVGQMEPYILVELTESAVSEIGRELDALGMMIERTKNHSDESSAAFQRRINKMESYLERLKKTLEESAAQEPEEVPEGQEITEALAAVLPTEQITELKVQMNLLTKQVELLAGEAFHSAGTLKEDVENIVSQTEVLSGTMETVMEQAEKLSLFNFVEDISQWNPEKASLGKVSDCANNGTVYGDKNVGGITGSMSIEYKMDPEDDLTAEFSMKERRKYQLTDIICDSINYASVTGKKDYVGGICGRMDLGYILESVNYGPVTSQNGDYVGGIAGWTGSTIRNCFVKGSLDGQNYIGGVVGSGITEDITGESSLVSQCYTMVDVLGYRQFVGAVAGVNHGRYEECYFVSEDLAGINRINYAGKAEPMTYEALLDVKNLPDEFETMEYLPKDENTTQINMAGLSVIASEEVREDGRPVFLAEGQFLPDAGLEVTPEKKSFQPKEQQSFWERLQPSDVVEQWRIEVPEDGLLIRTLRYLAPENNVETIKLYVKQNGDWKLAPREVVGSYLLVNISGCETEVAVVTTSRVWGYWLAAVLVLMFVAGGGIWMIRKKKDILKWFIGCLAVVLCILLIIVILVLKDSKFLGGIGAYQLLQQYLEQPEQAWELQMQAKIGEEKLDLEAEIGVTTLEEQRITCIQISDASFFYADGILYLENGDAYQASEVSADYGNMLQKLVKMYELSDIQMVKEEQSKVYTITVQEEYAQDILGCLLPGFSESDLEMQQLKAELTAQDDVISNILLTAKGKLQDEQKSKYQVSAVLTPTDVKGGQLKLPEAVRKAVLAEKKSVQAVITKDVFRLYQAWKSLEEQNTMGVQVYLAADCGPLTLAEDFTFISSKMKGTRINSVRKDGFVIYFNEDTICSENGYGVTAKRAQAAEAVELLPIAYELCLQGGFRCIKVNDSYIYSIALDESGMAKIAGLIAKESQDLAIHFENGSVQLVIKEDKLESIRFACDGELDVLLTKVAVALSAEVKLQDQAQYLPYDIPEKVVEKLTKEE